MNVPDEKPDERKPVETPTAWVRMADENRAVAEREMDTERPAYHTICFLSQSAAEKYLKRYLIAQGWELEKTHDLVALLGRCSDFDDRFLELREYGAVLNEYIVAGRYPSDLAHEAIGHAEAKEGVTTAGRIGKEVKSALSEEGEPFRGQGSY